MEEAIFTSSTDYVPTSYSYSTTTANPLAGAAAIVVILVYIAVLAGGYILNSWLLSRVFKKFGEKPVRAWIPFYNIWKFLELGGQKGFWMFVPGANVIFMTLAAYNLGKKIGKSDVFVLLYIFLQPIWVIIVGSNSSPIVAGAPTAVTPDNQFAQQPVAQPVVSQPAPVAQDFSAPVAPAPVVTEEPQVADNSNQTTE